MKRQFDSMKAIRVLSWATQFHAKTVTKEQGAEIAFLPLTDQCLHVTRNWARFLTYFLLVNELPLSLFLRSEQKSHQR